MTNYKQLVDGLDTVGQALVAIGQDKEPAQIKLLVSEIVNMLGFDNPEIGDKIAMLRYAVENDDKSLEKLTKLVTGGGQEDEAN
jgi:DNA-directed RNA polymerase delta subunit